MSKKFPKFIKLEWKGVASCAMRLQSIHKGVAHYYRDAGAWGLDACWVDGILKAVPDSLQTVHLKKACLIETTETEWQKDNGLWANGVTP